MTEAGPIRVFPWVFMNRHQAGMTLFVPRLGYGKLRAVCGQTPLFLPLCMLLPCRWGRSLNAPGNKEASVQRGGGEGRSEGAREKSSDGLDVCRFLRPALPLGVPVTRTS